MKFTHNNYNNDYYKNYVSDLTVSSMCNSYGSQVGSFITYAYFKKRELTTPPDAIFLLYPDPESVFQGMGIWVFMGLEIWDPVSFNNKRWRVKKNLRVLKAKQS